MPMLSRALATRTIPILLGAALALGAAGCDPAQPARAGDVRPGAGVPKWDARARLLFAHNTHPAAVGLSMEGPSPGSDPFLRERAQTSDLVARVRVQTVTVDSV